MIRRPSAPRALAAACAVSALLLAGPRVAGADAPRPPAGSLLPRTLVAPAPWLPGGGDGIVSGTTKTLGWLAIGGGLGIGLVGIGLIEGTYSPDGSNPALGGSLLGAGLVGIVAGALLLTGSNCLGCSTCGLVENDRREVPSEALAGRARPSDPAPVAGALAFKF